MSSELCPLCNSISQEFFHSKKAKYHICSACKGIFVGKQYLPNPANELVRYREHNNDVNDVRYQNFVSPIVNAVLKAFKMDSIGLDFGAGPGPVISSLLREKDYQIALYDPIFHDNPELLLKQYEYIICCEVIEHFHQPAKEIQLLKTMLKEGGKLYCMTSIYNHNIDFEAWYYKNDITHVFFYQLETLHFICEHFDFSGLEIKNNFITFSN
ncbi:MAG: methyltransferase [Bacteroidetes bacterium HGW-Bacteroidetes-1]|jgi:SAM-dependent methyltransferase|nr:MAG: methyltransferase [Bacteroidetes bacterium HGW-Bacteroidetes-1]